MCAIMEREGLGASNDYSVLLAQASAKRAARVSRHLCQSTRDVCAMDGVSVRIRHHADLAAHRSFNALQTPFSSDSVRFATSS
ncbi:hypothetical protein RSAG8_01239, partial [Rhizoctonia solani AG-8 WAC10335]